LALPAFQRRVYLLDDLANYHLPLRFFYARCLQNGDDFFWCPQVYCGFDLLGEGQVGMLHPLHWLLYRTLPIDLAFNAELLLSFLALWGGAWVFFRRWSVGAGAAAWGALILTFGGLPMVRAVHVNALQIIAHIPWLFVCVDAIVRPRPGERSGRVLAGLALVIGSQILLGYPQYVWLSLLATAAYAAAFAGSSRWTALPALAAATVVGALLGAVQLLPTYDALKESTRAAPTLEFRAERSLPPPNLLQPIAPYLFAGRVVSDDAKNPALSVEYACYFGGAIPALLLWAISRRGRMAAWPLARFGLWISALGVLLALGRFTPVFDIVANIPGVDTFRAPCRYLLLTHLGLAFIATAAFADLSRSPGWRSGAVPWLMLVAAVAGVCIWGCWRQAVIGDSRLGPTDDVISGAAVVAASTVLVAATAAGVHGALPVLVVFFAVDVGCYGVRYLRESEPQPPSDQPPRTFPDRLWMTPHGLGPIVQGWSLANGYVGLPPKRALDYSAPNVRRAAAVGIELRDDLQFAPLPQPLPRFRFVSKAIVRSRAALDATLATVDPEQVAAVDETAGLEDGASFVGTCEVAARVDRPGRIELDAQVESRRLLVITESWHRGWTADCNGRPRKILRVYGDFMGVVVEPGDKRVVLRYAPPELWLGCWFASAGFVGLAGLLFSGAALRARR
jgi:hypothetical protein